jgi:hypothetical protein
MNFFRPFGLLSLMLCVVLCVPTVYAACAITTDRPGGAYHPGESIVFRVVCSANGDQNKAYNLTIFNSSGVVQDRLNGTTTPNINGNPMFITWNIPTNYTQQNNSWANFTYATNPSGNRTFFNVTGLATNELSVQDIEVLYEGDWYWGETNAISAKVYGFVGGQVRTITGAWCKLEVFESGTDVPYYVQSDTSTGITGNDGDVIFNVDVSYQIFDYDTNYRFSIDCQTGKVFPTDTFYYNGSDAAGEGSGAFSVGAHFDNITAFLESELNETQAETRDGMCAQVTNSYRNYSQGLTIQYDLLCDVPNQDVNVMTVTNHELLDGGATGTFCPPVVIPELAAEGTGYCRVSAKVSPDIIPEAGQDYSAFGELFLVTPMHFTALEWERINKTRWETEATFSPTTNLPYEVGIDLHHPGLIDVQDRFDKVWLELENGSILDGEFVFGHGNIQGIEAHFHVPPNVSISGNQTFEIVVDIFSETSWMRDVLNVFVRIAEAIERVTGIGTDVRPTGNYTNISGVSSVSATNVTFTYNVTTGNASSFVGRKNVHIVYEFARTSGGVEYSLIDQNPFVAGYQAYQAYQVITINASQSKQFVVVAIPQLAAGTYVVYETLYEVNGVQPVSSGEVLRDERVMRQASYVINVTTPMEAVFDGDEMRFNGVIMSDIS